MGLHVISGLLTAGIRPSDLMGFEQEVNSIAESLSSEISDCPRGASERWLLANCRENLLTEALAMGNYLMA